MGRFQQKHDLAQHLCTLHVQSNASMAKFNFSLEVIFSKSIENHDSALQLTVWADV